MRYTRGRAGSFQQDAQIPAASVDLREGMGCNLPREDASASPQNYPAADTFADTRQKGPDTLKRIEASKSLSHKAEGEGLEPPSACARRISRAIAGSSKTHVIPWARPVNPRRSAQCASRFPRLTEQPALTLLLTPRQEQAS